MQRELATTHPNIQLLGVNAAGYSDGLQTMAREGDLPLLQDHQDVDAWGLWGVTFRDVVILGPGNLRAGLYNLTDNDLDDSGNYATLTQMFIDAADAASP